MTDEKLTELLKQARQPEATGSLDERVLAAYRGRSRRPFWKRLLLARIAVPAPVAAVVVLAVVALGVYAVRVRRPVIYVQQQPSLVTVLNERGLEIVPAPQLRVQRRGHD
jgi:hypothetical protein